MSIAHETSVNAIEPLALSLSSASNSRRIRRVGTRQFLNSINHQNPRTGDAVNGLVRAKREKGSKNLPIPVVSQSDWKAGVNEAGCDVNPAATAVDEIMAAVPSANKVLYTCVKNKGQVCKVENIYSTVLSIDCRIVDHHFATKT